MDPPDKLKFSPYLHDKPDDKLMIYKSYYQLPACQDDPFHLSHPNHELNKNIVSANFESNSMHLHTR